MFLIVWLRTLLLVILGYYFHSKFLGQLKSVHPSLYSELGSPTVNTVYYFNSRLIVRDLSPNNQLIQYSEFIAKRQWLNLNDPILNKYASYRRASQYVCFLLFIVALFNVGP